MSAGTLVRILVGRMRGKLGEVISANGRSATVRTAQGREDYLLSQLEAIS